MMPILELELGSCCMYLRKCYSMTVAADSAYQPGTAKDVTHTLIATSSTVSFGVLNKLIVQVSANYASLLQGTELTLQAELRVDHLAIFCMSLKSC